MEQSGFVLHAEPVEVVSDRVNLVGIGEITQCFGIIEYGIDLKCIVSDCLRRKIKQLLADVERLEAVAAF